jgi:hypothetical protein
VPEPATIGSAIKVGFETLVSAWRRGALLLWTCTIADAALFGVLILATHFGMAGASDLLTVIGIYLLAALPALFIFALFKTYSEFQHRPRYLSLIANEQQSAWGQTKQANGKTHTQISIRLQATNHSDRDVHLPDVRLCRPWVRRRNILQKIISTESPKQKLYSRENTIPPHKIGQVLVMIILDQPIGTDGRRMHVTIKVQDHTKRWHRLSIPDLKPFRSIEL